MNENIVISAEKLNEFKKEVVALIIEKKKLEELILQKETLEEQIDELQIKLEEIIEVEDALCDERNANKAKYIRLIKYKKYMISEMIKTGFYSIIPLGVCVGVSSLQLFPPLAIDVGFALGESFVAVSFLAETKNRRKEYTQTNRNELEDKFNQNKLEISKQEAKASELYDAIDNVESAKTTCIIKISFCKEKVTKLEGKINNFAVNAFGGSLQDEEQVKVKKESTDSQVLCKKI